MLNHIWMVDISINNKVGNEIITQEMETPGFGHSLGT